MTPRQVKVHLTKLKDSLAMLRGELEDRLGFELTRSLMGWTDARVAALQAAAEKESRRARK